MKKIIALLLTVLFLSACAGGADPQKETFNQANIEGWRSGVVMETETGYYYNKCDGTYACGMEMHYCDKSSGKDIILCNKPECPHGDYPFCAAAGSGVLLSSALYKDYIYNVKMQYEDNKVTIKLYRTSLDGTELTEVATIYEQRQDDFYLMWTSADNYYMAVYNDTAFFQYSHQREEDGYDDCGLAIVDIKTGRVTKLEELSAENYQGYQKLIPYENYLYYYISQIGNKNLRLYRYDLSSGKAALLEIAGNMRDYCIVDGKVVFLRYDDDCARLYTLDPDTGEISPLSDSLTDENGECIIKPYHGILLYDGEHFIVGNELGSYNYRDYYIYDKSGKFLAKVTAPDGEERYGMKTETYESSVGYGDIHIENGKMYFVNYFEALYCPMSDVLAGNVHWETAYTIHEYETEQ